VVEEVCRVPKGELIANIDFSRGGDILVVVMSVWVVLVFLGFFLLFYRCLLVVMLDMSSSLFLLAFADFGFSIGV
jgi:hypothetical protein